KQRALGEHHLPATRSRGESRTDHAGRVLARHGEHAEYDGSDLGDHHAPGDERTRVLPRCTARDALRARCADEDGQAGAEPEQRHQGPHRRADASQLDPLSTQHVARTCRLGLDARWRLGHFDGGHAVAPTVAWYSTLSAVKVMKASSREDCTGLSSCKERPAFPARSPICAAVVPCTWSSSSSAVTAQPSTRRSSAMRPRSGDLTRTYDAACSSMNSRMLQSARILPRPITTRCSAVSAISDMR